MVLKLSLLIFDLETLLLVYSAVFQQRHLYLGYCPPPPPALGRIVRHPHLEEVLGLGEEGRVRVLEKPSNPISASLKLSVHWLGHGPGSLAVTGENFLRN